MKKITLILIFMAILSALTARSITMPNIADTLYIGQVLNLELDLSAEKPERLYVNKSPNQKQIEFLSLHEINEKPWNYLIRIAAFDTGFVSTGRIELFAIGENRTDSLFIEPFSFYVKSSLTLADSLIRDIAPPIAFRLKLWDYIVPLCVLFVILLLVYLYLKFKKKKIFVQEVVDDRPAWVIVMEMLKEFKLKQYLKNGQYLDYYFDLSLIFRFFIEKQHGIKAVEMTTYEIKQALQEIAQKNQIIKMLSEMDKIKFAKFIPSKKDAEDLLYWIENYILSFSHEAKEVNNV